MIEVDFFGSTPGRSPSEREALIEQFAPAPKDNSNFLGYGYDYYDNPDYGVGYGGYHYDGRYGESVAEMISHYGLAPNSVVLELGCAKGFVLTEFKKRGMEVRGIDVSAYATDNAVPDVKPYITHGSCDSLDFDSDSFDLVYAKEVLPHVTEERISLVIAEAARVCRTSNIFFDVQVANDERARDLMKAWDETHQCLKSAAWWRDLFRDLGFAGQINLRSIF